jgi:hypothetical protein
MRRRLVTVLAVVAVVAGLLYAAHSLNLVGMLLEMHGSMAAAH